MAASAKEVWRKKTVEEVKLETKSLLDTIVANEGLDAKLDFIMNEIKELDLALDPMSFLKRFILIISALFHHMRFGGLNRKQIVDLTDMAYAILRVSGIKPGKSQVSFLYGELHLVLSEIHLSNGEFLEALWEQQISANLSNDTPEMIATRELGMGIYSLRLGHSHLANAYFDKAESDSESQQTIMKSQLNRVRSLRLASRRDAALKLCDQYMAQLDDNSPYRTELIWEKTCLEMIASENPLGLTKLCKRGQPHYHTSYLLECFLWLRCLPSTQWFNKLPKLSSLAQYKEVRLKHYPILYAVCQAVEAAYDKEIPISSRLGTLKKVLPKLRSIRNIDKELLAWLAVTRWLHRNRYKDLAALTFHEYLSLSNRLSLNQSQDALGVASDLTKIDWVQKL
ncbi:hypothetical protein [Pseudobacteriovorax antillogorgiicola]|uniref:Uncharacterized protein n=1 Tax=Pseudobacteriovorax antillogorgiicola TaxID=1513793 RepID=A0A1Y6BRL4_9BACT|nr:hypothetical protein [Pseudobacteriovorax antillogorgiicola]TCS53174.1 hypothetical protein EDD56_108225 [Pseudobacteriovorax antillogorgiicola]SMF24608.1 hypothetical protein SAMN06296036_10821 [Pseudobacteriovorax antillogorgiicola]